MPFILLDRFNKRPYEFTTVGELIEELKKYSPDTPIVHEYDSSWGGLNKPQIIDGDDLFYSLCPPKGTKFLWINPGLESEEE